jgi:hypothetical protein
VTASLRELTTTGKPLKFDDVEHAGRPVDTKDSARLRQANVSPTASCVVELAK